MTHGNGLSVLIPSKTASNVFPCIRAVQKHEPDARIIVIDDGVDWQHEASRDLIQPVYRIEGVKPFVFARNVNLGIVASEYDDVIVLNDDALLESPGGFTLMQQAAEDYPEFGIIGAVTNLTGQPLQRPHGVGLRQVPHIAFVCVLIPRRTIDQVGMLDERYRLDYGVEDRDYCEAVNRAGLKVGVHDHCYVDHGSLWSSFRGDPKQPKSFQQNYALFLEKWGPEAA